MNDGFKNSRLSLSNVSPSTKTDGTNAWFVESSASIHMSSNKIWLENYHEIDNGANIYLGDERLHPIKGYGDISMTFPNGGIKKIQNVMYTPSIKNNVIYVSPITDQDLKVEYVKSNCDVGASSLKS